MTLLKNVKAIFVLILLGVGVFYMFMQKPTTGLSNNEDQIGSTVPEKVITTLYDENGKAIIESCFLEEALPEYTPMLTEDWVPAEYYTKDYTIRFLLPQGYSLRVESDDKYILTGNPPFEAMLGSIYTTTEDFLSNSAYYTGYSNNYGIAYTQEYGWGKQYIISGRFTDYSTCDPKPYVEVNNRKVFVTGSGDAGAQGESFITEVDNKIVEFNMAYVLGGDAGEGADLPDNPKEVAGHIRNVILTILGTAEVDMSANI